MDNTRDHNAICRSALYLIKSEGAWGYKVWGGPMQRRGIPDVIGCLRGRMIAIEVKTGTGRLTPDQAREKARIEEAGGIYILAGCPEDVERRLMLEGLIQPSLIPV